MKRVYGKNVFVTGASSGIGQACAISFAKAGYHVIGTAINCKEHTEYFENGGSFELYNMDVTKESEVQAIMSGISRIDIAVLCAGIGIAGPVEEVPMDLAKLQMEVNYFGTLRMCQYILPKMREQQCGLVLVVSSVAGKVPIPMQSHYSSSKYALEAMVECIHMEMKAFGVRASLIEPGDTNTGFTDNRKFYDDSSSPYKKACAASVGKMEKDERNGRSPQSVADVAMKLASKRNPPVRIAVGIEYKLLMFVMRFVPDQIRQFVLRTIYLPRKIQK